MGSGSYLKRKERGVFEILLPRYMWPAWLKFKIKKKRKKGLVLDGGASLGGENVASPSWGGDSRDCDRRFTGT